MKNPIHILVIRLSAMGDVAMTVPVLQQFSEDYPEVKITVLTKPFFGKIFAHLNQVTIIEADVNHQHKGVFGIWKLHKQCKALGIDAVADLHNVLRSRILRFFFSFSSLKTAKINKGRAEKKALTRETNKIFKPLKTTHQRYAEVFKDLAYPLQLKKLKRQKINLKPEAKKVFDPQTSNLKPQTYIGIAPFAAHKGKQYPLDKMTRVIKKLNQEENLKILLFGGGLAEVEALSKIAASYENVVCIAGQFPFEEELAIISNLDVMLSMDSGNGHLAAMFGVPVITLWGVTHPFAGFAPFDQPEENQLLPDLKNYPKIPTSVYGHKVPEGYEDVMETIAVEKVTERILKAF